MVSHTLYPLQSTTDVELTRKKKKTPGGLPSKTLETIAIRASLLVAFVV